MTEYVNETEQILDGGMQAQNRAAELYFGSLDALKENAEMNDDERSRHAWGAHEAGKQLLRQAVEDRNRQLEQREASLNRKLFGGPSSLYGDQKAREEYTRAVREVTANVHNLDGYMEMALKTGDKILARAAFAVADQVGDPETINRYLNSYPDERELFEERESIPSAEERESAALTVGDALMEPTESMVRPTQEALDRAQAARQYRPLAG